MDTSWRYGREYIQRKAATLAMISTSQLIFGVICVVSWIACFEFCKNCQPHSKVCDWTISMQGVWGGSVNTLCGILGIVQACKPKRIWNTSLIFLSVITMLCSLGMIAMEVLAVKADDRRLHLLQQYVDLFIKKCLNDKKYIWNCYHYALLAIGGLCVALSASTFAMTSYAQHGCCGTYCRELEMTSWTAESEQERMLPPYSPAVGPSTVDDLIQLGDESDAHAAPNTPQQAAIAGQQEVYHTSNPPPYSPV